MEELTNQFSETSGKKVRKLSVIPSSIESGKLPPQALELEEAILGALMLERDAVNDVIDILQPDSFYREANQKIFSAIRDLFQKSEPIDILTVTNELRKRGELEIVGGPYYISQLTNRVASASNAEFHARIISQKHILRELIRISSETIHDAYEDTTDVFDLLDKAERSLFSVAEGNIRRNFDKMSTLISKAIKHIEKLSQHEDELSGIPSGFTALDRITSGWQRSDLIVMAARPGMGKTAFALTVARNVAVDFKKPVAVFSLEMSSLQLVNRLISSETELAANKLKRGNLEPHEWEQLNAKITQLSDAPIFIDDTPALSIFELRTKCRRLKAQHQIELIIVDYLQLMTAGNEGKGNREQEISSISRSMKSIAKELDVPIISISQLSRAVETRGGSKRPQLSDLRESGAIEQDADLVMFIYRPEYYGITEDESGVSTIGKAEIIIAKHRNGATATVPVKFFGNLAKFEELEESEFSSYVVDDSTEEQNTITRKSKMDDMDEDGNAPF